MSMFRHEDKRADLTQPTEEMLELQANRYEALFHLLSEYRTCIDAVTFWGSADDYTWLNDFPVRGWKNWPLLFDEKHEPKASFWRVVKQALQA